MINKLKEVILEAGGEILKIYNSDNFEIENKSDNSPLTTADKKSHEIIKAGLEKFFPDIPLLSEEGKIIPYEKRKNWNEFWLVDPLDGTKEFIKRNGEFTVNIALVKNNHPVLGIIYAPVLKTLYYGYEGRSFKQILNGSPVEIKTRKKTAGLTAVQSRSHSSDAEEKFLSGYDIKEKISAGSSLKFCLLAEGKADIYFRGGPTYEWDTAAGHAIAVNAGAVNQPEEYILLYNKQNLLNGAFCFTGKDVQQS